MVASSTNPEGVPSHCPICQNPIRVRPSSSGDSVCSHCGTLVWPDVPDVPTDSEGAFGIFPGRKFGNFQILRKIDSDVVGAEFLAFHQRMNSNCVLEVLRNDLEKYATHVERMRSEACSLSKLKHPHIAQVFKVSPVRNRVTVIVKEFVDGPRLQECLDEHGKPDIGDALHIISAAAEGLDCAHRKRIIHRNIKPDNLLINRDGMVKVAGFGVSRPIDTDFSTLDFCCYMAPEQARNPMHVDGRVDIYSLGTILYQMVTGKLPFTADSALELILKKENDDYTPAAQLNSQVPASVDRLIGRMLEKKPDDRHPSGRKLVEDIQSLGLASATLDWPKS